MVSIKIGLSELFNSWIDVLDLAVNSEHYLIMPLNAKIVCRTCGGVMSVRMRSKYISFLCPCGCRVFYPPDKDGVIVSKFVSKEEYEGDHVGGRK